MLIVSVEELIGLPFFFKPPMGWKYAAAAKLRADHSGSALAAKQIANAVPVCVVLGRTTASRPKKKGAVIAYTHA